MRFLKPALADEFPEDEEMRLFAAANIFEVAKLLCEKHDTIWIRRSLSHGLGIFVDD